jgi:hypothetical protein
MNENLAIGRLAKAAGAIVETIRNYQRRGLSDESREPLGSTLAEQTGKPRPGRATLDSYGWREHCCGLFQTPITA